VQVKLSPYGFKFINNMRLKREGTEFEADGYDRAMHVGFEYLSHEGTDFQDEDDGGPDGLTKAEIAALRERQATAREYFLFIPEGPKEDVERAIEAYVESLYAWEVLKRKEPPKKDDNLFPEDDKKKDLLPWEVTGDLKKKRKEMEEKEKGKGEGGDWDTGSEKDDEDAVPVGNTPKGPKGDRPAPEQDRKPKSDSKDDKGSGTDWGGEEDEGDEVDF
jgi:hypothetical protein